MQLIGLLAAISGGIWLLARLAGLIAARLAQYGALDEGRR